ncbi:MAG: hypothetical protein AABZ74_02585 [Cyanobacteriota bacterium]
MKKILRFILLVQIFIISNCNIINNEIKVGYIIIGVKFPEKQFNVKKIPLTTNKIELELSGTYIPNTLKFILTPEIPKLKLITPSGNMNLKVNAFDINNKLLAQTISVFYVKPYIHNIVEMELTLLPSPEIANVIISVINGDDRNKIINSN